MENAPPEQAEQPAISSMSLGARLTNVFVTPGEVFERIKTSSASTANWLVPILLACLCGIIYVQVIYSQPGVQQQLQEQREKQIEKMVAKGTIKAEQVEQTRAAMEKFGGPAFVKIFGSIAAVVINFGLLFLVALGLWLLGTKIFKGQFTYFQAVEAAGLSTMIGVLGVLIGMLLVVNYGNMFITPGPSLLIRDFNTGNKAHLLLASINLITLWYVGVLAVAVAKLSGVTAGKAAVWLFGVWLTLKLVSFLIGAAAMGL